MTPTDKKKRRKHPTETQEGPSLEERLSTLFSSVGAGGVMARQRMEDPAIKILDDYEAQRTAPATKNRLNKVRKPEVTNIFCEEFEKFRKQYPDWKPNTPRRGAYYVAEFLFKPVNNRVTKLLRVKKKSPGLKPDTIARYLTKQYPDLFMSD
jgi:hypothetical protein